MDEKMVKIENLSKMYKLGQIGGTTLKEELQRKKAKIMHKEDPTKKIGTKDYIKGEIFWALKDINLGIKKGERVGIIGHNGAGKSTLLKLLSRVTAPTEGRICLNGRIASMLEVGTGFHGELTGRENIYMNGAILGMNKKEIDAKMEDIIEFSECRQFIDTPVKRYSSGMYVKLAFSVAAHLDAEIMIMDEVLAVGDMAFQTKCLEKMNDVSKSEGRTILYVSHNMNTIRQLCDRVIVLNHGEIVFDGGVEDGIEIYLGINNSSESEIDLSVLPREKWFANGPAKMLKIKFEQTTAVYKFGSSIQGKLFVLSQHDYSDVILRFCIKHNASAVTSMETAPIIRLKANEISEIHFEIPFGNLAPAKYSLKLFICRRDKVGAIEYLDVLMDSYMFEIDSEERLLGNAKWNTDYSGFFVGDKVSVYE